MLTCVVVIALLHPYDYPLSSDSDYLGHDRGYHNSAAAFPSNEYLNGFRNPVSVASSTLSSGAVPVNSNVKYHPQPVFQDSV